MYLKRKECFYSWPVTHSDRKHCENSDAVELADLVMLDSYARVSLAGFARHVLLPCGVWWH